MVYIMTHPIQLKLQALANPARLHIAQVLIADACSVDRIACAIGLSQSATSQHLRKMRECGLVTYRPDGTTYMYRWDARYPNGFFASIVGLVG